MFIAWKPEQENTVKELKAKYNKLIERHDKAAAYIDNGEIPFEKREKYVPSYRAITEELNTMLKQFDDMGVKYTKVEILEGFNG